jgi:hypothetical protein
MRFESTIDNAMVQKDNIAYKGLSYVKAEPLNMYDERINIVRLQRYDVAFKDTMDDRLFFKEEFKRRWVDINGGSPTQNYWFDIDANDNSHYPGYLWSYDTYYVLDGGGPVDACPKEEQWAPLHSPNFVGVPKTPTPPTSDESNRIANAIYTRDKIYDFLYIEPF